MMFLFFFLLHGDISVGLMPHYSAKKSGEEATSGQEAGGNADRPAAEKAVEDYPDEKSGRDDRTGQRKKIRKPAGKKAVRKRPVRQKGSRRGKRHRPKKQAKKVYSGGFMGRVVKYTRVVPGRQDASYTVSGEGISGASAVGIVLGMLRAMDMDPGQFGRSRLYALALGLAQDRNLADKVMTLRRGDVFRIYIGPDNRLRLAIKSFSGKEQVAQGPRVRTGYRAGAGAGSRKSVRVRKGAGIRKGSRPGKRAGSRTGKRTGNSFVRKVLEDTRVIEENRYGKYRVPGGNMPNASAVGVALGMLQAMEIRASQFGQTRLYGLALRLVLDKRVRTRASTIYPGDVFRILVSDRETISLSINDPEMKGTDRNAVAGVHGDDADKAIKAMDAKVEQVGDRQPEPEIAPVADPAQGEPVQENPDQGDDSIVNDLLQDEELF